MKKLDLNLSWASNLACMDKILVVSNDKRKKVLEDRI